MSLAADIQKEKNRSLDVDPRRWDLGLLKEMEKIAGTMVSSIEKKLDAPTPNEDKVNESDAFRTREANKKIKMEWYIDRIFKLFNRNALAVRARYYRHSMDRLGRAFNRNTPRFLQFEPGITETEINAIPNQVNDMPLSKVISQLKARTIYRFKSIAIGSYKAVKGSVAEYRSQYRKELAGAVRGMMRSFEGILKGLLVESFEVAMERFTFAVNEKRFANG